MNWYYVRAGRQVGPVEALQLNELYRNGKIKSDTMIWCDGMENWEPYSEAAPPDPRPVSVEQVAAASGPTPSASTETTHTAREAVCVSCGKIFDIGLMTQFADGRVCPACKPTHQRKLAERAQAGPGGLGYAGFWIRFGALFLDNLILRVVSIPLGLIAGQSLAEAAGFAPQAWSGTLLVIGILELAIVLGYETIMIGKFGATLGKMACRIKVVTPSGGPVSYSRAAGRSFAKMLSYLLCLIGFIMAAFDSEKRALHDRMCGTRVVFR